MQAREFFVHIGMLIIEGRIPQYSDKGRVEGPHCLSLFSVIPHVCHPQEVNSVSALSTYIHVHTFIVAPYGY